MYLTDSDIFEIFQDNSKIISLLKRYTSLKEFECQMIANNFKSFCPPDKFELFVDYLFNQDLKDNNFRAIIYYILDTKPSILLNKDKIQTVSPLCRDFILEHITNFSKWDKYYNNKHATKNTAIILFFESLEYFDQISIDIDAILENLLRNNNFYPLLRILKIEKVNKSHDTKAIVERLINYAKTKKEYIKRYDPIFYGGDYILIDDIISSVKFLQTSNEIELNEIFTVIYNFCFIQDKTGKKDYRSYGYGFVGQFFKDIVKNSYNLNSLTKENRTLFLNFYLKNDWSEILEHVVVFIKANIDNIELCKQLIDHTLINSKDIRDKIKFKKLLLAETDFFASNSFLFYFINNESFNLDDFLNVKDLDFKKFHNIYGENPIYTEFIKKLKGNFKNGFSYFELIRHNSLKAEICQ